jgi:MerR family transcriptional regulator, redox-sensitive transcriptional activator SoxR
MFNAPKCNISSQLEVKEQLMNTVLKIGEVAAQTGLHVATNRYYENLGLLPIPHRVNTHRVYDKTVLQRLAFIRTAQRVGFTLTEIGLLLHQFDTNPAPAVLCNELVEQKLLDLETLITQAQHIKRTLEQSLHCSCTTLYQCTHTLNGMVTDTPLKLTEHG